MDLEEAAKVVFDVVRFAGRRNCREALARGMRCLNILARRTDGRKG